MKDAYPSAVFLHHLAQEAGEIMLKNFNLERDWTFKDDSTPLTNADLLINGLVIARLLEHYPHISVLGEEGDREVEDAEYTALCDPIDGTSCFALGIPTSAFCLTIVKGDEPLAGVIHDPFMRRTWIARKGEGAFLNGARIHVSEHSSVDKSNVMLVKWLRCGYNLARVEEKLMERGAKVQNVTSLAYFGGLIASGTVEASIFPGTGVLESAAMQVIVEEAGGKATSLFGERILYASKNYKLWHGSLVSNGRVHDQIMKVIESTQPW